MAREQGRDGTASETEKDSLLPTMSARRRVPQTKACAQNTHNTQYRTIHTTHTQYRGMHRKQLDRCNTTFFTSSVVALQ